MDCARPCEKAIALCGVEIARWTARVGRACGKCGATNPIALKRNGICYRCEATSTEIHHPKGHHLGPPVEVGSNLHRVLSETARILASVITETLCGDCTAGISAWLAASLTALGGLS